MTALPPPYPGTARRSPALSILSVIFGALALVWLVLSGIGGFAAVTWLLALVGLGTGIPALASRAAARPAAIVGVILAGITVGLCILSIAASAS